jgi:PEP-CTERM/exosortase A-associated glycosyltransferase
LNKSFLKPMRVLHILDHSIPLHSGYTFRSAALLREQRALGWDTFHLTSPKQGHTSQGFEEVDGLSFFRTNPAVGAGVNWPLLGEFRLMQQLAARISDVAADIKPDVIHAHSPVLNAIPALRIGRKLGIPVVYEIRAFWEDAAVDHGTTQEGSLRYRLTRGLETRAIRQAAHVFTICEGLRADIAARGIPAAKVTVIPNAVDVSAFQLAQPADPVLKQQWGLHGRTVIGFIGSFYAYEGLDLLLRALPALLKGQPDVCLLLVGGGPQEHNLKSQARALGLQDRVIFTGRVPHSDVNRYYDLIDVLAYPRHSMRLTELVTPLKPLEAMAQGQLFVASDVGGHRELVEHQKTGILFKAGDPDALAAAILDLLKHQDRWPALRANGRHFVESVRNWRNSVANYKPVYEALAKKALK